jgi:hypothetical protein
MVSMAAVVVPLLPLLLTLPQVTTVLLLLVSPLIATMLLMPLLTALLLLPTVVTIWLLRLLLLLLRLLLLEVLMVVVWRTSCKEGGVWQFNLVARALSPVRARQNRSLSASSSARLRPSHSHRCWRWLSRLQYHLYCPHRHHRRDPIRRREGTALLHSGRL